MNKGQRQHAAGSLVNVFRAISRCNIPPGIAQYMLIGHRFRGDGSEEMWWSNKDGGIETASMDGQRFHFENGSDDADYRGRIDHSLKQISLAESRTAEQKLFARQRLKAFGRKLQRAYL